jgi:hypothetical protein
VASLGLVLLVQAVDVPRAFAQALVAPSSAGSLSSIHDGELVAAIERSVHGARRRLARRECAAVFDEFADQSGRTLSEVAASLALSPDDSLVRVIFRDGRESASCRVTRPAAFTGVGSRVVFVCPAVFGALDREAAELVIIHELLHTLGLGERPPSSAHINRVVARRCS